MSKTIQHVIAIDFGLKRLGIAVANTFSNNAEALKTLHINSATEIPNQLLSIINEWQPNKIIMGMPYNADGSESKMAKAIKKFAKLLETRTQKPIEFIDESFTSHEANRILVNARQSGSKNSRVQKGDLDKMAAAIMLQRWLDQELNKTRIQCNSEE